MAVDQATKEVIKTLKSRAAQIWGIDVEAVEWRDGAAYPTWDSGVTQVDGSGRESAPSDPLVALRLAPEALGPHRGSPPRPLLVGRRLPSPRRSDS